MITRRVSIVPLLIALTLTTAGAQPQNSLQLSHLRWRMIGPHRGGRTVGVAGINAMLAGRGFKVLKPGQ